jgi:hypothetical protein
MSHPHPKGPTPEVHVSAADPAVPTDTPAPAEGKHVAHPVAHPAGTKTKPKRTKRRIEEKRVVVAPGGVTVFDKLKKYYKGLIMTLGAVLIILNEATPLFDNVFHGTAGNIFTSIVAGATTLLAILKSNEHWVDSLP